MSYPVTFDEALDVLGIDASVDEKGARRAYFRAVKAHPPERDPAGFERVREAYELIRSELPYRGAANAWRVEQAPEDNSDGHRIPTVPMALGASEVAPKNETEPSTGDSFSDTGGSEGVTSEIAVERALQAKLDGLEYGSEEAIRACRDAVKAAPGVQALRWELIDQLEYSERAQEVPAEVLRAHRDGLPGFLDYLLWNAPTRLRRDELAHAAAQPETRAAAASAYTKLDQPVRAAKLFIRVLEASGGADASLDFAVCAPTLLALLARGKWKTALRLQSALNASAERAALFERSFEGSGDVQRLLVAELFAVRESLPKAVIQGMAEALSHSDPVDHDHDLVLFAHSEPGVARRAQRVLKRAAPNLYSIFNASLSPKAQGSKATYDSGCLRPIIVGVLLLNLVRMAGKTEDPEPASLPAAPTVMATPGPAGAARQLSASGIAARYGVVEVVPLLLRIETALAKQECSVPLRDVDYAFTLADAVGADAMVSTAITKLQDEYRRACPMLSEDGGL